MPTQSELFEIGLIELLDLTSEIDETTARTAGSRVNALLNASAAMAAEVDFQRGILLGDNLSADTAQGEALQRLGYDRYRLRYLGATASIGTFQLVRTLAAPAVTVVAGTQMLVDGAVIVAVDVDTEIPNGSMGPITCPVTSIQSGSAQNVTDPTATIEITGTTPQAGITAQVTSAVDPPLAGGNDAEDLDDYRDRLRSWWINQQRGTVGAIENGARVVEQVREAAAFEDLDEAGHEAGTVQLIVSDASGHSNATMLTNIAAALLEYRGAGISVVTLGATVVYRDLVITGTWIAGMATPSNEAAVRLAVVAAINRLNPNAASTAALAPDGTKITTALVTSAMARTGFLVPGTESVVSLVGDEAPGYGEVIRTTYGRVTFA
jgi:hypothetical protein